MPTSKEFCDKPLERGQARGQDADGPTDATSASRTSSGKAATPPDAPSRKAVWARRAVAVLFFVAIAVLVDVALTFALENYGMTHEVTWYDYRRTPQGTIDTLVVGSSFASLA